MSTLDRTTQIHSEYLFNIGKQLFSTFDEEFKVNGCPDEPGEIPKRIAVLADTPTEKIIDSSKRLGQLSTYNLAKQFSAQQISDEVYRLHQVETQAWTAAHDREERSSPIIDDVNVLDQIFAFAAMLYGQRQAVGELLVERAAQQDEPVDDSWVKALSDYKDSLVSALYSVRENILEPILEPLRRLLDSGYGRELGAVISNIEGNMIPEFFAFLDLAEAEKKYWNNKAN